MTTPDRLFAGYAIDLDGTIYLGDSLLPQAAQTIERIRLAGSRLVFLTNNPLHSAASYSQRLTDLGIPTTEAEIITPLAVLTGYLNRRHPGGAVLTVAEPLVDAALAAAHITVTAEPAEAEVVVVAFDRTFNYAKLLAAYRAVRHFDAVIVATNPDPFCPTPDGGLPDCAAMLAAVEACTGARAEAVMGKPTGHMAAELLRRLAVPPASAAMVGDRISTDVAMARTAAMASVLVMSGATSAAELAASSEQPDFVISDLGQLLPDRAGRPPTSPALSTHAPPGPAPVSPPLTSRSRS